MKKKPQRDWENPEIIGHNKQKGRVVAKGFSTIDSAFKLKNSLWEKSLNGAWKFKWSKNVGVRPKNFYKPGFIDDEWNEISVPGVWQLQGYDTPYYIANGYPPPINTQKNKIPSIDASQNPVGSYRKKFQVPLEWKEKEIFIHFGAVKSAFYLWINGNKVGYSQGSMTPAEFNITKYLHKGQNTLAVEVYRYSDGTYLECQDMWYFSGIYRDVFLFAEPTIFIQDFFVHSQLDDVYQDATLTIETTLKNACAKNMDVILESYLTDSGKASPGQKIAKKSMTLYENEERGLVQTAQIKNPKKWSAETPHLYTIIFVLKYKNGKIIQVKKSRHGFRSVEIQNEQLLINGKPILIKGVNRHDFDPDFGWTVPEHRYYEDLKIMKQNNINAIRTSHYPNPPLLYEICDEWGLYVMDEADVETHGVRRKNCPGDHPQWTKAVVDRVSRMAQANRNHPCIIIWSLGNEAGDGENFKRMKEALLELDDTRPVHYEGDHSLTVSDFVTLMYPTVEIIDALGQHQDIRLNMFYKLSALAGFLDPKEFPVEKYTGKPVILCEYAHALENSLGNFDEYTSRFEKYTNVVGGYIWDFVDQSVRIKDQPGNDQWLYGGDFGEKIGHRYFCANGIVAADRTPHPALFEVKKNYQFIKVREIDVSAGIFIIENQYAFITLDNFDLAWEILEDGTPVSSGYIKKLAVKANSSKKITIPYTQLQFNEDAEYHLTISFHLNIKMPWCEKGTELAWEQFQLSAIKPSIKAHTPKPVNKSKLSLVETDQCITISSPDFSMDFNKTIGGIESLNYGFGELIVSPLIPNFWRAYTDNDRNIGNFVPAMVRPVATDQRWESMTKKRTVKHVLIEKNSDCITIMVLSRIKFSFDGLQTTYYIFSDGRIQVKNRMRPTKDLIRFGMQVHLPNRFNQLSWFGKGPHETYIDRKNGAKTGIFSNQVKNIVHNYMRPQENGNLTDIRWAQLTAENGEGIRVQDMGKTRLNVSAWPYSQDDLNNCEHIHELPATDFITFNIDLKQRGVGGDLPGLINLHEPYILHKNIEYSYDFLIQKAHKLGTVK